MAGTGVIVISPVLQEALFKATSFVDGRASLPQVSFTPGKLKNKIEELVQLLTAIQAVVEGAEEMQETDPAIRLWLEMLSDSVYDAVDALDEVNYSVLEKVVEIRSQEQVGARGKEVEIQNPDPEQEVESSSFDSLDYGRHKETEIQSQSPPNASDYVPMRKPHGWLPKFRSKLQKGALRLGLKKPPEQKHTSFSPSRSSLLVQTQKQEQKVHTSFSPSTLTVSFREEMADKFTEIIESLSEIRNKVDFIDLMIPFRKKNLATAVPNYAVSHLFDNSKSVVGRDGYVSLVVNSLVRLRSDHPVSGISMVGMAGIGKTAVASLIYRMSEEKSLYDVVYWVSVSEGFDDKRILKEMLECCNISAVPANGEVTVDQLLEHLCQELEMKSFLLILDDFWEKDCSKWNVFASHLSKLTEITRGRCSIILTTQSECVASASVVEKFAMGKIYMRLLVDYDCWSIMKETILELSCETLIQSDMEDIGMKIAKQCGGLPLVAAMMGETLSRQFQRDKWVAIADNDSLFWNSEDGNKILSVLKASSFDRLSSPLKKCFSYCSILPRGCAFEKDDLVQLWIAQGFLHQPNGSMMTLEDVGNKYFSDLLSNSLFQIEGRDDCGNISSFNHLSEAGGRYDNRKIKLTNSMFEIGIRDDYRNVVSCKMHDIVHDLALFVSKGEALVWKDGCCIDDNAKILHLRNFHESIPTEGIQRLRSLLLRDYTGSCSMPFVLKSLQCLEGYGPELKEFSVKSTNLKYLSISGAEIEALDRSLSKLYNLKTLKLTGSPSLPFGLTSCVSLRNLNLLDCHLTSIESIVWLSSLESLELRNCRGLMRLPTGLDSCTSFKKLKISDCHDLASIESIEGLSSLESLVLQICDGLTSLPTRLGSSTSLKFLRIAGCSMLTSTQRLHGLSSLENLELISCNRLTSLPVELGSCISLKNLTIRHCHHLFSVESNVGLSSLKSLEISKCQGEEKLSKREGDEWEDGPSKRKGSTNLSAELRPFTSVQCKDVKACDLLTSLLPVLGTFDSLKEMKIFSCSHLTSIESIAGSSSLESLELCRCDGLKNMSANQDAFNSLKNLRLSYCHNLTSIGSLAGSSSLESLELNWCNGLKSLLAKEDAFNSLKNLRLSHCSNLFAIHSMTGLSCLESLELSNCDRLSRLPQTLSSCTSLKNLIISHCGSLDLKKRIEGLKSLERLELMECNKLRFLPLGPGSVSSLQRLIIKGCEMMESFPTVMEKFPCLLCLEISDCENLKNIPEEWLGSLTSLRELTMGPFWSELEEFPGFSSIHHLQTSIKILRIRGWRKLESLPRPLEQLTALEELELQGFRRVLVIPDWLGNFSSLKRLKVEDCYHFSRLPSAEAIQRLSNLQYLEIKKCPLFSKERSGFELSKVSHISQILVE